MVKSNWAPMLPRRPHAGRSFAIQGEDFRMADTSQSLLSRRRALARVGLLALGAYTVPAVTSLSYATTVSLSKPKKERTVRDERSGPSNPDRQPTPARDCGVDDGSDCAAGSN